MCGIVGIVRNRDSKFDPSDHMAEVLRHRGPDENGFYKDKYCSLGMRRLSIIDVEAGHQPIHNELETIFSVFNGQIYNYKSLRRDLISKGHILKSSSDGEVIPHLYEEYGENFVEKLEGMFAIALWDSTLERLYLYRDRFGKKPLLYTVRNGDFLFASELKALVHDVALKSSDVDSNSIESFLHWGYIPHPHSILSGYKKLQPGHRLLFHKGSIHVEPYYKLSFTNSSNSSSNNQNLLLEEFERLFSSAVEKRLVSERPLGAFLSGGIDSSMVVAKMTQLVAEKIKTFSIGFDDVAYDESSFAQIVSQHLGTKHHLLVISSEMVRPTFESLFDHYDEPFGDSSALPTLLLSQLAANHVVVALSGDGGDEAFGGYERYLYMRRVQSIRGLLFLMGSGFTRTIFSALPKQSRMSRGLNRLSNLKDLKSIYQGFMFQDSHEKILDLIHDHAVSRTSKTFNSFFMNEAKDLDWEYQSNLYDIATYLPDDLMYKVDIASMANSLEIRSPFLDHHLMEFGLRLPRDLRVKSGGKAFLKIAASRYLPPEIINRKKMGFGIPKRKWIKNELKSIADDVFFSNDSYIYHWIKKDETVRRYRHFVETENSDALIWSLMCLEMWSRKWLTGTR